MTAVTGTIQTPSAAPRLSVRALVTYLALGVVFGVVLMKSEVVSWFRVQEMFRFQSAHMYLTIVSAIATAAVSLRVIRRWGVRSLSGEPITVPPKVMGRGVRYAVGGTMFGLGWGLVGACPAPLFALLGSGLPVFAVVIANALVGTWSYGVLRPYLPH